MLFLFSKLFFSQSITVLYDINFKAVKNDNLAKEIMALDIDTNLKKSIFYSQSKKISNSLYQEINNPKNLKSSEDLIKLAPSYSFQFLILKNLNNSEMDIYDKFHLVKYDFKVDNNEKLLKLKSDFSKNPTAEDKQVDSQVKSLYMFVNGKKVSLDNPTNS